MLIPHASRETTFKWRDNSRPSDLQTSHCNCINLTCHYQFNVIPQLSGCKGKIIFTLTTKSFVDCRLFTKEPGNKLQNNGIDYYPHNQILISLRLRLDGSHLYPPSLEIWKFKTITPPPPAHSRLSFCLLSIKRTLQIFAFSELLRSP